MRTPAGHSSAAAPRSPAPGPSADTDDGPASCPSAGTNASAVPCPSRPDAHPCSGPAAVRLFSPSGPGGARTDPSEGTTTDE